VAPDSIDAAALADYAVVGHLLAKGHALVRAADHGEVPIERGQ
jgi:hypothetical protein